MDKKPRLPIAPPQRGDEPGTWAYKTISSRFVNITQRIIFDNNFTKTIEIRLESLIEDIPFVEIRHINDPDAPDQSTWKTYTKPYLGMNWHQPPWFFTEHYFYRRILEATRYFQPGEGYLVDPFSYQKRKGIELSRDSIRNLTENLKFWCESGSDPFEVIKRLMYINLWGNQADYSLWPAEEDDKPDHPDIDQALTHILVDHAGSVAGDILVAKPLSRVDFLVDNAGFELVSDLIFSDYLISSGMATTVRLHVKQHPTYVSDAMENDIRGTIAFLLADQHRPTRMFGKRLGEAWKTNALQIKKNWFWTSPLDGWFMPEELREELSQSDLVISKGDANYRRLLGDRHWSFTTSFEKILSYFPTSLVALRTLKSELVVGLADGQPQEISKLDPEWLTNGRWGLIQHFPG